MIDLSRATWRKSSRSNSQGQCVEVAGLDQPLWRKSSRSNAQGQCVEVAGLDQRADNSVIAVRDSKHPDGPVLVFTPGEWAGFVAGVHDGEFDL
ncbi:MAG: DUF397 domain-containing protein [Micromonosporaceae bacterium]|nr:DUF397 domain-containing protein [Micromonosporaceae bacterium]